MSAHTVRSPIPGLHRHWLLIGLLLAFTFRLILAYLSTDFPFRYNPWWGDTKYYYQPLAKNLVLGHGFSTDLTPPYRPSVYRGPIYPLFMGGVYWLTSFSDRAVAFVQILLSTASCLVFYGLAREFFADHPARDAIALVAFFFIALNPFINAFNVYLLAEPLAQILFLFAFYWMLRAMNSGRGFQAIASGVFAALTFLTHVLMAAAVSLMLAWLLVLVLKDRTTGRLFLGFALGVFITWTPWAARNYTHFHRFIPLTVSGGLHLYWNVWHLEENPDRVRECLGIIPSEHKAYLMTPDGLEGLETDARCYRLAWGIIRDHPGAFARHAIKKPVQIWASSYSSIIFPISDHFGPRLIFLDQPLVERLSNLYSVSQPYIWFLVGGKLLLGLLNPFFLLTGLFGLIKVCRDGIKSTQWPVLLVLVGHTVVLMFISDARARYVVVVWPYLVLLSAYGCWALWQKAALYRGAPTPQEVAAS